MDNAAGLKNDILRFAAKHRMFEKGGKVLVALSGGADSVALIRLLDEFADGIGITLAAAHLNHRLRGEESDRDERFVRDLCGTLRIPLLTGTEDVAAIAASDGAGIEETARKVRYRFLREAALRAGCAKIATAHNANDNAETILLNLTRGSGTRGLGGIPPVRGDIVRPLLCVTRSTIERYLSECGAEYMQDSTNFDTTYTRNKIRHMILPVLQEINPSFVERALDTAELLRGDGDYLDRCAEEFPLDCVHPPEADCRALLASEEAVAGRVVRRMYALARKTGEDDGAGYSEHTTALGLTKKHVDAVLALAASADPSGRCDLPKGVSAYRRYGKIALGPPRDTAPQWAEIPLAEGETRFGQWIIRTDIIAEKTDDHRDRHSGDTAYLKPELLAEGLYVRGGRTGDTFSPAGRGWTKTLKKMYIDMKIPCRSRAERPVIACESGICAVPGIGADKKFSADAPPLLRIVFCMA